MKEVRRAAKRFNLSLDNLRDSLAINLNEFASKALMTTNRYWKGKPQDKKSYAQRQRSLCKDVIEVMNDFIATYDDYVETEDKKIVNKAKRDLAKSQKEETK